MRTPRSPLHGPSLAAPSRAALLVALTAFAVIIGLAAMHALSLHCTPTASHSAPGHLAATAPGSHAQPHTELSVAHVDPPPAAAAASDPGSAAPQLPLGAPLAHDGDADPHGPGLALLCMLVLFIAFLRPGPRRSLRLRAVEDPRRPRPAARLAPPRPPSLHALGISRT